MSSKACCDNGNHMWPRGQRGGSFRSIGNVQYEFCNNCLAIRIIQENYCNWPKIITTTTIVEPKLSGDNVVVFED
jgi:hypothetical protein